MSHIAESCISKDEPKSQVNRLKDIMGYFCNKTPQRSVFLDETNNFQLVFVAELLQCIAL